MALPPEELRGLELVTLGVQALALELMVRELELVGAPCERGFGEHDLEPRKTSRRICENRKFATTSTELTGRVIASIAAAISGVNPS